MQHPLSTRENWEAAAGAAGGAMEEKTLGGIQEFLDAEYPGEFLVEKHPTDLKFLYLEEDQKLHPERYLSPEMPMEGAIWYKDGAFYTFKRGKAALVTGCGSIPDLKIQHRASKRGYFIECKVQNESGNAHERCAKYATPSMIEMIQARLPDCSYHPIGYIFGGPMITKLKYRLELQATYAFAKDHLVLWDTKNPAQLHQWLQRVVLPLLRYLPGR